jgi:hypothetical protein
MRKAKMEAQKTTARKFIYRFCFICIGVVLVLISRYPDVYANESKPGDSVTIITPGTEARLCPQPACGPDQHIVRIPEGTVLTIQATEFFAIGTFKVIWFEVVYQEHRGWISIYDTDLAKK